MYLLRNELIATRATLIDRLKDWENQAGWQDFFDTYGELIFNVAVRGGLDEQEAQEVLQETMLSVAKMMPNFSYDRQAGSFKSWLLQNIRWRIADQLRRRKPAGLPMGEDGAPMRGEWMPSVEMECFRKLQSDWDAEWDRHLLAMAVAKVKRQIEPRNYQIFDFFVNKEWSVARVARAFGICESQVYVAKNRVAELLRQEVERLRLTLD